MPRIQRFEADLDKRALTTLCLKLRKHTLLLPSVCVAEINIADSIKITDSFAPWAYGYYAWHEASVPLIDIDGMMEPIERLSAIRHIAILYSQEAGGDFPFYAIVLQEAPVFYSIEHGDLQIHELTGEQPYILSNVQLEETLVQIPNMVALGQLCHATYKSPQRA